MKNHLSAVVIALAIFLFAHTVQADYPSYRILQSPTGHHGRWASPGHAQAVHRPSYAWGYFGATRHTNSYHHNGYYGWYWQRTDW